MACNAVTLDADMLEVDEELQEKDVISRKRLYETGDSGRCSTKRSKGRYAKKRRFKGNQFTPATKTTTVKQQAASLSKVKAVRLMSSKKKLEGYRLIDMGILNTLLGALLCPDCGENDIFLDEDFKKRKGLSSLISINCHSCEFKKQCYSSKTVPNSSVQGAKPFEINFRAVYAARTIGQGYSGLERFCGMMNLPRPPVVKNFDKISHALGESAREVAETSMNKAVTVLRGPSDQPVIDIRVSLDGTWQKRGFTSNNGTVAAISMDTGKIIDIETMNRYCKPCDQKKKILSADEFHIWFENHTVSCSANYEGSAPMMEVEGAKRIFKRSIESRKVRYMEYYGDGDSKAYSTVKETYAPDLVKKRECVGHYQKRVGTRLRALKKKNGKIMKPVTDVVIDKLQNYFGIALRANTGGTVKKMSDAIYASFLHVASSESNNFHSLCDSSWCQFQRDKLNGTNLFKHGQGLPDQVKPLITPIYKDLLKPEELEKCLHGMTQNQNESYNALIWERAPKSVYISIEKMKFAVYDAVAVFNDGRQGSLDILKRVGVNPGYYTTELCSILNIKRRAKASVKSREEKKIRRRRLRASKTKKWVANKQKEGKT